MKNWINRKLTIAIRRTENSYEKEFPTFNPQDFDLKNCSVIWFGSLGVFLLTSCAAFCFDSIFVIMQRYNRPRLIRLMKNKR